MGVDFPDRPETFQPVRKVLVVAQTPPPTHGQAVMNQYLLQGQYQKLELHHVRMAFSEEIGEVGGFRWKKVFHLATLIAQIVAARLRHRTTTLYYPPASPNMVPFLRDCVLLIATRWMFQRTVFHFHANGISGLFETLPFPLRILYRLAYSKPDVCICITRFGTADAEHFQAKRIEIVPNGIPDAATLTDSQRRTSDATPLTILFLATVSLEKGAGILLEATARLRSKGNHFRCLVAGPFASRQDEKALMELSSATGLNSFIAWAGPVSDNEKWRLYREADIFCFPSMYSAETFGLVLVEAMMFGLPVVSTVWRGIPDVVEDGKTGFLVPTNDPKATADRLEQLLADAQLRKTMGQAGRERYEGKFTVEKFRLRMEEVLSNV